MDADWKRPRRDPPKCLIPWIFTATSTLWAITVTFDWAMVLSPVLGVLASVSLLIIAASVYGVLAPIGRRARSWTYSKCGEVRVNEVVGWMANLAGLAFVAWMSFLIIVHYFD